MNPEQIAEIEEYLALAVPVTGGPTDMIRDLLTAYKELRAENERLRDRSVHYALVGALNHMLCVFPDWMCSSGEELDPLQEAARFEAEAALTKAKGCEGSGHSRLGPLRKAEKGTRS